MRKFLNETVSNRSEGEHQLGWASISKGNYLNIQLKFLVLSSERNLSQSWTHFFHRICNNSVRHSRQQLFRRRSFFYYRNSLAGCADIIGCDLTPFKLCSRWWVLQRNMIIRWQNCPLGTGCSSKRLTSACSDTKVAGHLVTTYSPPGGDIISYTLCEYIGWPPCTSSGDLLLKKSARRSGEWFWAGGASSGAAMHGGGAGGQPAFGGGGGPKDPWEVSFFWPIFLVDFGESAFF